MGRASLAARRLTLPLLRQSWRSALAGPTEQRLHSSSLFVCLLWSILHARSQTRQTYLGELWVDGRSGVTDPPSSPALPAETDSDRPLGWGTPTTNLRTLTNQVQIWNKYSPPFLQEHLERCHEPSELTAVLRVPQGQEGLKLGMGEAGASGCLLSGKAGYAHVGDRGGGPGLGAAITKGSTVLHRLSSSLAHSPLNPLEGWVGLS